MAHTTTEQQAMSKPLTLDEALANMTLEHLREHMTAEEFAIAAQATAAVDEGGAE